MIKITEVFYFKNLTSDIEFKRKLNYLYKKGWSVIDSEPIGETSVKLTCNKIEEENVYMKTYRIWEVEENLNRNPKLKFETKLKSGNAIVKYYDGYINFVHDGEDQYTLDYYANELNDLNREWVLVQEPVDFMTAINSGRDIRSEYWNNYKTIRESISYLDKYNNAATELQVINGKWYIRED